MLRPAAFRVVGLPLFFWLASLAVHAQTPPVAPAGIYNCVDSKGRNITSDRPIADCLDREQRELNPSGTTRRKIEPNYTAKEQAERDERARQAAMAATRQQEERRRERALLVRYPTPAAHDRERKDAIAQIDAVIVAARKRLAELTDERKKIDDELEFYKSDVSKAPGSIRRQFDDNAQSMSVQNRFIGEQEDEKKRVNARFDEERARLKVLWGPDTAGAR
ncbi:MAG: DUF4124 domain-containing protein [Variovorax sp.]